MGFQSHWEVVRLVRICRSPHCRERVWAGMNGYERVTCSGISFSMVGLVPRNTFAVLKSWKPWYLDDFWCKIFIDLLNSSQFFSILLNSSQFFSIGLVPLRHMLPRVKTFLGLSWTGLADIWPHCRSSFVFRCSYAMRSNVDSHWTYGCCMMLYATLYRHYQGIAKSLYVIAVIKMNPNESNWVVLRDSLWHLWLIMINHKLFIVTVTVLYSIVSSTSIHNPYPKYPSTYIQISNPLRWSISGRARREFGAPGGLQRFWVKHSTILMGKWWEPMAF